MAKKSISYRFSYSQNDPAHKGELAGRKLLFGPENRYAVAPVHTRFDSLSWFVFDALTQDPNFDLDPVMGVDHPAVIRQAASFEAAIAGLV